MLPGIILYELVNLFITQIHTEYDSKSELKIWYSTESENGWFVKTLEIESYFSTIIRTPLLLLVLLKIFICNDGGYVA